jgi:transposase InsO family protein
MYGRKIGNSGYKAIVPLFRDFPFKADFLKARRDAALAAGVSERTVIRWRDLFREHGFDSLKGRYAGRPPSVISDDILQKLITLKRENPLRSVASIIKIAVFEGWAEEGELKRSSVQAGLARANFSKRQIMSYARLADTGGRRFQREKPNDLWQSDFKHGPVVEGHATRLMSFMDDNSRFITHSEFYHHENTVAVFDCLRKAIEACGVPASIYVDQGPAYKSRALTRSCARLGITRLLCKPFCPKSKGKIERFHQHVDMFLSELKFNNVKTLAEINKNGNTT